MSANENSVSLHETLCLFREKVNEHARIHSIIKGWEPVILIEASDTQLRRYLPVRSSRIVEVAEQHVETSHSVHLRGTEEVLTSIFDGRANPAESFLDGALEIFASDKDQVKLDAISLVLWGV